MKQIKIIDNLAPPKTLKPIQLLYCLQSFSSKEKLPQWCLINSPSYHFIDQLTRVGKHSIDGAEYDVIVATNHIGTDQTFWLGHWNDGVVHEQ